MANNLIPHLLVSRLSLCLAFSHRTFSTAFNKMNTLSIVLLITSGFLLTACDKGESNEPTNDSISVDKTMLSGLPTGQLDSIMVTSTTNWNLVVPPAGGTWIAPDKNSGIAGTSKVRFIIAPNATSLSRNAVITINSTARGVPPVMLTITQARQ